MNDRFSDCDDVDDDVGGRQEHRGVGQFLLTLAVPQMSYIEPTWASLGATQLLPIREIWLSSTFRKPW